MITGILLVQATACAVLSAIVASNKNRNVVGWGALGFFFGVLGFIASIAVSEVEPDEKSSSKGGKSQPSSSQEFDPDDHEKKCPTCAEYIKLEAKACRYCGHEFSEEEVEQQVEERKKEIRGQQKEKPAREVSKNENPKQSASTSEVVTMMTMWASVVVGTILLALLARFFG